MIPRLPTSCEPVRSARAFSRWQRWARPYQGLSYLDEPAYAAVIWEDYLKPWLKSWARVGYWSAWTLLWASLGVYGAHWAHNAWAWGGLALFVAVPGALLVMTAIVLVSDLKGHGRSMQRHALRTAVLWGTPEDVMHCWRPTSDDRARDLYEVMELIPAMDEGRAATYPWERLVGWWVAQGGDLSRTDGEGRPLVLKFIHLRPLCAVLFAHGAPPATPEHTAIYSRNSLAYWMMMRLKEAQQRRRTQGYDPHASTSFETLLADCLATWDLWQAHGWIPESTVWFPNEHTYGGYYQPLLMACHTWGDMPFRLLERGVDPTVCDEKGRCYMDVLDDEAGRAQPDFMGLTTGTMIHAHHQHLDRVARLRDAALEAAGQRLGFASTTTVGEVVRPARARL